MALEMMIQIYNWLKKSLFLLVLLFSFNAYSQSEWIIGARKFDNLRGKSNSITDGITEMFPSRILEKLGSNLYRNATENELQNKEIESLKKERTSLFLQLSSENKKRDSFVTGSYSKKELEKKIKEQEEKIKDIQKKIDDNLSKQKELEAKKNDAEDSADKNSTNGFSSFLNALFSDKSESSENQLYKVSLYKNDFNTLFTPSKLALKEGIKSSLFETEIKDAGINGLISGKISIYGDYYSLTVELYLFPGAEMVATATEVGSFAESDLVSSLIARELIPSITNSLPVKLKFNLYPQEINALTKVYLDNELVKNVNNELKIDAGVHKIQFICEGYESISTSYSFLGNKTYKIDVNMHPVVEETIKLKLPDNLTGNVYLHGKGNSIDENNTSTITINNKKILGIFISDTNEKAFFVIPENSLGKTGQMKTNLEPFDRSQNIEKHRRRMYNSYSALLTSLIPTFFTMGQANSYNYLYASGNLPDSKMGTRDGWNIAQNVSIGLTAACGVWFVYELVQYFVAADSVLPDVAKVDYNIQNFELNKIDEIENIDQKRK